MSGGPGQETTSFSQRMGIALHRERGGECVSTGDLLRKTKGALETKGRKPALGKKKVWFQLVHTSGKPLCVLSVCLSPGTRLGVSSAVEKLRKNSDPAQRLRNFPINQRNSRRLARIERMMTRI